MKVKGYGSFRKYTYSMQGEMFIFRKDNPGAKNLPPFSLGPPFKTTLVYVWMGWGWGRGVEGEGVLMMGHKISFIEDEKRLY